jgi:hypothetical protein
VTDSEIQLLYCSQVAEGRVESVRVIQTHTSWVLLTGKYAYKIKKPVYFGFLDYTTLEARKFFCEEELRLNERLSPDIYLGVRPITRTATGLTTGGKGEVIDYCLKMKELPQDTIMTEKLRRGEVTYAMIDQIARIVAEFHRQAATDPGISRFGELETVRFNWDENFAQTEEFRGATIGTRTFRTTKLAVERFMTERSDLFAVRVRDRKVRECHGDLHSRNIFIGKKVRIFDCIEFNRRFSCCDVASEVAFFVMDLEYCGAKNLANYFVDRYVSLTGDQALLRLLDFYKCYRAYVRGKVTSFNLKDSGVGREQRQDSTRTARSYFRLAAGYAQGLFDRPALILMMGLPGVGKTFLADRLTRKLNCYHLRSDIIRKELTDVPVGEHKFGGVGRGIYASTISARTYAEMHARAAIYLAAGRSVILDATFSFDSGREKARKLAEKHDARFLMINCVCPVKKALQRISQRAHGFSFSDATPEVYFHIRKTFQPARRSKHLVTADTTNPVARSLKQIETALFRL